MLRTHYYSFVWLSSSDQCSCECYALQCCRFGIGLHSNTFCSEITALISLQSRGQNAPKVQLFLLWQPQIPFAMCKRASGVLQLKRRRYAVSERRHFFTFSRESFTFCLCNYHYPIIIIRVQEVQQQRSRGGATEALPQWQDMKYSDSTLQHDRGEKTASQSVEYESVQYSY